jgi:tetratricopeptide (TPR) repeat protein
VLIVSRFDHIFWIDASSQLTIEQSYKGIAAANGLDGSGKSSEKADVTVEAVLRWLENSKQEWLLLFDNCENIPALYNLIPSGDRGNILYTSRDPTLSHTIRRDAASEISIMECEEAVTLLFRSAHSEDRETDDGLAQIARRIVEELGFLPLAIDIAGASIHMGRSRFEDYIDTFHKHRDKMMKDSSFKGASHYNQAVYTTWDISYTELQRFAKGEGDATKCQDAKFALKLLHLFAFQHHESIMEETFKRAAESRRLSSNARVKQSFDFSASLSELLEVGADGIWDPFHFRKGLSMLLSLSLVTRDRTGRYFSMHVLVHSWARDHVYDAMRLQQTWDVTALLSSSISWEFQAGDYAFRRQLLPHIRACGRYHVAEKTTDTEDLEDASNFSLVFYEGGYWREAEEALVHIVETRKKVLGKEHPSTLTSMANLASTYRNQGRWKEAEQLFVQVMETSVRVLGDEHPSTLTSMANLASTYSNQGRWKEAEELEVQVMEMSVRVLGDEHPSTLTIMANLASTYSNQGRWKEAEELEVQVIETRKRVLGDEHPDTLTSMNNLAFTLKGQGRTAEAISLMEALLQAGEKVFGSQHPNIQSSRMILGYWRLQCR